MEAIAHSPSFAKKVGVPQSVGQDFAKADKGRKFSKGGDTMATRPMMNGFQTLRPSMMQTTGNTNLPMGRRGMKEGGMAKSDSKEDMKADKKQDVALIKKAFKEHDAQEHKGGKGTTLKLAKGGTFRASANGIAERGKTKGTMVAMCGGGMTKGKK
jgi:hypothetical protein